MALRHLPPLRETCLSLLLLCLYVVPICTDPLTEAMMYLQKYQYIGQDAVDPSMKMLEIRDGPKLREAIREFQRVARLPQTGVADGRTLRMMRKPRCGIPDVDGLPQGLSRRSKRYALLGSKWKSNHVTYRILSYSQKMSQTDIDYYISKAFKIWMKVTPLQFHQVFQQRADIEITFGSYSHGDPYPFDGRGNTLAHAFTPGEGLSGDVHFDESEVWNIRVPTGGTDLFTVAVHEIGHALGLSHSYATGAIMRPFYDYVEDMDNVLTVDDVAGVQYLYGPGAPQPFTRPPTHRPVPTYYPVSTTTQVPTTTAKPRPVPEFCRRDIHFDAIVTTNSGKTYAFEGWQYVYILNGGDPYTSTPKLTSAVFKDLHWGVDAAFSLKQGSREVIYILKLWFVWTYDAQTLRPLRAQVPLQHVFPDLPNYIDTVFRWNHDGNIYAFKGTEYWKLVSVGRDVFKAAPGYPRSFSDWNLPGTSVNAAMSWSYNGKTYFFSGPNYYKYDDRARKVESGYPRNLKVWWLGCPDKPNGLNLGKQQDAREGFNAAVSTTATTTLLSITVATLLTGLS